MDFDGKTVKFEIKKLDCYLKVGHVDETNQVAFPHLDIGDVCYVDLTISRGAEEMRVYEVLLEMANRVISVGGTICDAADVLFGHQFEPSGWVRYRGSTHRYGSICDFVGKFLRENYCGYNNQG